jgi:hypothetical protein
METKENIFMRTKEARRILVIVRAVAGKPLVWVVEIMSAR